MNNIIGSSKASLDTPCLVIDKSLLLTNIKTLQQEVNRAGKKVRPHAKTHKCTKICLEQINHGAIGISVAKVSEAWVLAEQGFKNTLITSPVVTPLKIEKLMRCLQQDPQLTVVVDNLENAQALNTAAKNLQLSINVLVDIDPGIGRTGISHSEVINFCQLLKSFANIKLMGIQCYAGNLQHIENYQARCSATKETMQKAANTLRQLNIAGFNCKILSGSGTGTYESDLQIPEVTEIQPGSYTVMDSEYFTIGSAENASRNAKFKSALTLLTSIISVNHGSHVTCDAGWKALYQVPTKPLILKPEGYEYDWGGFGDEHGKITVANQRNAILSLFNDGKNTAFNSEQGEVPLIGDGKITAISSAQVKLPLLGDRLELMVAHCDPTINMYDAFYITENDIVVDVWPIDMRGKSQ